METEKKYKSLLAENSRLKAVESSMAQVSTQKKNMETVIADLERSLKERETKEGATASQIDDLNRRIQELEAQVAVHAKEVAKMVN